MKIEKRKVLVTGGAGFIGSHIVDALLREGAEKVIVIDNFSRGRMENLERAKDEGNIEIVFGDIRDPGLIDGLCKGVDYVYHQAALRIPQCMKDPRLFHEVMIDGTYNVFEACIKNNIKKLIFASSSSVYGEPSYLPMDEDHPLNNKTYYGFGKIYAENLARLFKNLFNLNYICLRYFNVYGPRMDTSGAYTEVMIKWLERIDAGKPPIIYGNGKQFMDFVFVDDVVRANILALKSDLSEGFYNVGTGEKTDLTSLCKIILEITGSEIEPEYLFPENISMASSSQAGVEKSKKAFGFQAEKRLKDGINELIDWRKGEALLNSRQQDKQAGNDLDRIFLNK